MHYFPRFVYKKCLTYYIILKEKLMGQFFSFNDGVSFHHFWITNKLHLLAYAIGVENLLKTNFVHTTFLCL